MSKIPKIIHYCWFGGNPLPDSAIKCIESWKQFMPDYQIIEWNESTFNIDIIPYTQDAYKAKKYAFVSDYARFFILYKFGGIYFDTDVELIKPISDIVENGAFMGAETDGNETNSIYPIISPGLCIGTPKEHPFLEKILNCYNDLHFLEKDGRINKYTMIPLINDLFIKEGMTIGNRIQNVADITLYPSEYFNPLDIATGRLKITPNTRSIHWFMGSWMPHENKWLKKCKQYVRRFIRYFKR